MSYNQTTNAANPALQGRNPAFRVPQSPVAARAAQLGELAGTQGMGLAGQAAGGTAAAPSQFPGGPQASVAPGGPFSQGQGAGAFGQMPAGAQGSPQLGGQMGEAPRQIPGAPWEQQNQMMQQGGPQTSPGGGGMGPRPFGMAAMGQPGGSRSIGMMRGPMGGGIGGRVGGGARGAFGK